jgi:hypothetical protein
MKLEACVHLIEIGFFVLYDYGFSSWCFTHVRIALHIEECVPHKIALGAWCDMVWLDLHDTK